MKKKILPTSFCTLLIVILSLFISTSNSRSAQSTSLQSLNEKKGQVFSELTVKAWRGNGTGGVSHELSLKKGTQVYRAVGGKGNDSQTAIVSWKPVVTLLEGHYYELTTEVMTEGVTKYFDFSAAVRSGKMKDFYNRYQGKSGPWEKRRIIFKATSDARPTYFAVRLYGSGQIWATPFVLRKIDSREFKKLRQEINDQKKRQAQKRLERVMRKAEPSLPLAGKESPQLFRMWGTEEGQYPPPPLGWKLVSGEYQEVKEEVEKALLENDFLIYSRNHAIPVYHESVPRKSEIVNGILGYATPGEYEPLTFSIYTKIDLEEIDVRVSDLLAENGQSLKSFNIDVRTVNYARKIKDKGNNTYYLMPLTLGKGPDFIEANHSRRYWFTVFVPQSTKPGVYRGKIEFVSANTRTRTVPIEFTVLPFQLLETPTVRFLWNPPGTKYKLNESRMFRDMAGHGMTTMLIHGGVKTRDRKIGQEDITNIIQSIEKHIDHYRQNNFRDNPIGGISNNQIIYYWDKKINWFRYWPVTKLLDRQFLSTYRSVFIENKASREWPDFFHYIVDEPGGANPKNIQPSAHYLKIFKKEFPQLKTFVTIGGGMKQGYDEVGLLSPYLDVTSTNYVTKDLIDTLNHNNSSFWVYNGSSMNLMPIKERFFFGWYSWKIGARGVGQWTYAWTGNPYSSVFRDGRQDYALETKSGFIPTVGLEMIREGIDDSRYIHTAARLIQYGIKSHKPLLKTKALKAKERLKALRERININYQRGTDVPKSRTVGLHPDDLDDFRNELVMLISELVEASGNSWHVLREKVLSEVEHPPRIPTEADWKKAEQSNIGSGVNLLSSTRFGGLISDWKIQIWRGRGGGDFDENSKAGSGKAANLYISSNNMSDNGALVLHKPDILFGKGIRYRLSAWIKTTHVSQHVYLYGAIRGGGVSNVMSRKLRGTNDWTQVWVDFSPEEDTQAQYFAVRLWGKGSVSVNRIMLQEF